MTAVAGMSTVAGVPAVTAVVGVPADSCDSCGCFHKEANIRSKTNCLELPGLDPASAGQVKQAGTGVRPATREGFHPVTIYMVSVTIMLLPNSVHYTVLYNGIRRTSGDKWFLLFFRDHLKDISLHKMIYF